MKYYQHKVLWADTADVFEAIVDDERELYADDEYSPERWPLLSLCLYSGVAEQINREVITEDYDGNFSKILFFNTWTGEEDAILVLLDPKTCRVPRAVEDVVNSLDSYHCLDDEKYLEMQWEAEEENWRDYGQDELWKAVKKKLEDEWSHGVIDEFHDRFFAEIEREFCEEAQVETVECYHGGFDSYFPTDDFVDDYDLSKWYEDLETIRVKLARERLAEKADLKLAMQNLLGWISEVYGKQLHLFKTNYTREELESQCYRPLEIDCKTTQPTIDISDDIGNRPLEL